MSAAQASRTEEEIWAHSKMAEEDREMLTEKSWREGVRVTFPECGVTRAPNVKFCPECGLKNQARNYLSGLWGNSESHSQVLRQMGS
jgi:uncharacterized OB-fold protein